MHLKIQFVVAGTRSSYFLTASLDLEFHFYLASLSGYFCLDAISLWYNRSQQYCNGNYESRFHAEIRRRVSVLFEYGQILHDLLSFEPFIYSVTITCLL